MKTLMLFLQNTIISTLVGVILGIVIKVAVDENKKQTANVEQKKG